MRYIINRSPLWSIQRRRRSASIVELVKNRRMLRSFSDVGRQRKEGAPLSSEAAAVVQRYLGSRADCCRAFRFSFNYSYYSTFPISNTISIALQDTTIVALRHCIYPDVKPETKAGLPPHSNRERQIGDREA